MTEDEQTRDPGYIPYGTLRWTLRATRSQFGMGFDSGRFMGPARPGALRGASAGNRLDRFFIGS